MVDGRTQSLSLYHAIYGRRMAWKFKDKPVTRSAIERMLDAAVWAPNHRMTEPWRFIVLEKGSPVRQRAAELAGEFIRDRTGDRRAVAAGRNKVLHPPYVIYVYCVPGPDEETTQENYAAVCCAAQNISLAGATEGLAVTWETGGATKHKKLGEVLGAEDEWVLTTMLLIGYPDESPRARRTPVSRFVRWFGLDQMSPAITFRPERLLPEPDKATLPLGMQDIVAYCFKCRNTGEMDNPKPVTLKNGRPAADGSCKRCGTRVFRILKGDPL